MSRDIKFRIWNKVANIFLPRDWKYGDKTPSAPLIDIDGRLFNWSSQHWGIDNELTEDVENYVIQQFIGLKDKNGREIYEGDIIKFSEHKGFTYPTFTAEVVFDDKRACFGFREHILVDPFAIFHELEYDFLPYTEIIGNIFENPDLLKQYARNKI